ncbi:hypothetical protein ACFVIL_29270 [Streptomyces sp. NPDC127159]|uniref:hypothetical protein n=1 Tax=unclassified Streptomyces TaxID=2593676 RepID=UPI0036339132
MPATLPPLEDALTLTDAQVRAIVPDHQADADAAAEALATAEADPASVTPAELAELQQAADYAARLVPVAEKRWTEILDVRVDALRAEALQDVQENASTDLADATALIGKFDALETALRDFCTGLADHNARLAAWNEKARNAKLPQGDFTSLRLGTRIYQPFVAGKFVASLIYRVMNDYPDNFIRSQGHMTITHWGDPFGPDGSARGSNTLLDLRELIRKDA